MLKAAPLAQTGGNILTFFTADVEGWLEYGNLKMRKQFAPILIFDKMNRRTLIYYSNEYFMLFNKLV